MMELAGQVIGTLVTAAGIICCIGVLALLWTGEL